MLFLVLPNKLKIKKGNKVHISYALSGRMEKYYNNLILAINFVLKDRYIIYKYLLVVN